MDKAEKRRFPEKYWFGLRKHARLMTDRAIMLRASSQI